MCQKEVGYLFQNISADFNIPDNTYFYDKYTIIYTRDMAIYMVRVISRSRYRIPRYKCLKQE